MKQLYQLSLTCEYEGKNEFHILHIGKLLVCKAVKILSKQKQKQLVKKGDFPKDAKVTYKIEKYILR